MVTLYDFVHRHKSNKTLIFFITGFGSENCLPAQHDAVYVYGDCL